MYFLGFPGSSAGKESDCNVGDLGLIAELGRFPGEFHGQRNLAGYRPWIHKEFDPPEKFSLSILDLSTSPENA